MLTNCKDELPNPHKDCVRQILSSLICLDHDLKRINIELRVVKEQYQSEIDKIENKCSMLRTIVCKQLQFCGDGDELKDFTNQLHTIDEVNECFKGKIDEVNQRRNETLNNGRTLVMQLQDEKCKLKKFHEASIEHLKRLIINTDDPQVVRNCEKDICQMQKLFSREVSYIKTTENNLRDMINSFKDAEIDKFCQCCCFKEYEWLPPGKNLGDVAKLAEDFKSTMGATLKRAYAQLHVHQPEDPKFFLAAYLFNVHRNEEMLAEKLNLFGNFTNTN